MDNKPLRSTADSWLISAGIKTLPGTEKQRPSQTDWGGRCSPIPEAHRLSIYDEIEKLLLANNKMSNPAIYDALADMAILNCRSTGNMISLGTISKYTSDVKNKLGIIKRAADFPQRFADYKNEGVGRSTIMREMSQSVYGYEQLLKDYKTRKQGEQNGKNNN